VRRFVLLVIVALLVASSALWAGTYKAAQEMVDLTRRLPLTIAASALSISASSVTPLAYLITPHISECSDPAGYLCSLPLDRIEFS
jgi:uncharacterized protein YcfL